MREYAWRHTFAYADQFVCTVDATAYADWYAKQIANEDNASYWPGHGQLFDQWRRLTEDRQILGQREPTNGDF